MWDAGRTGSGFALAPFVRGALASALGVVEHDHERAPDAHHAHRRQGR